MTILHLVRKSAFETSDFQQCIDTLVSGDQIILLDDGCYNIHHPLLNKLTEKVMTVQAHANARGVEIPANSLVISMKDIVKLTFKHNSVITWQ